MIASKVFYLKLGDTTQLIGDQLTAIAGTAATLNIQIHQETGTLSFQDFQKGDIYKVLVARTGDMTAIAPWVILFITAVIVIGTIVIYEKKKQLKVK